MGSNKWAFSASCTDGSFASCSGGIVTLSGTITQITIKPTGSNNFDGGSAQIHGE